MELVKIKFAEPEPEPEPEPEYYFEWFWYKTRILIFILFTNESKFCVSNCRVLFCHLLVEWQNRDVKNDFPAYRQ